MNLPTNTNQIFYPEEQTESKFTQLDPNMDPKVLGSFWFDK